MTLVLKKIDDVPAATARWIENLRFINHAVLCYLAHRLCKESPACKQAWHEYFYLDKSLLLFMCHQKNHALIIDFRGNCMALDYRRYLFETFFHLFRWAINYAKGSIGVPTPEEKPERYGYVELRHFCSLVAHMHCKSIVLV